MELFVILLHVAWSLRFVYVHEKISWIQNVVALRFKCRFCREIKIGPKYFNHKFQFFDGHALNYSLSNEAFGFNIFCHQHHDKKESSCESKKSLCIQAGSVKNVTAQRTLRRYLFFSFLLSSVQSPLCVFYHTNSSDFSSLIRRDVTWKSVEEKDNAFLGVLGKCLSERRRWKLKIETILISLHYPSHSARRRQIWVKTFLIT